MILLITVVISAAMGIGIGLVLRNNAVTPYGLGNHFGRHYLNDHGVDTEENSERRWDD